MFQHILIPLDGSLRAEQALPVAARIARSTGASLLLVQVVNPVDYHVGLAPVPMGNAQVIETEMAEASSYLTAVAEAPMLAGIETRVDVVFGFSGHELLSVIASRGIDLVVLCSHGRTGLARWALGSVAHTLVHQSTAPVFVLRDRSADALLTHSDIARPL